MSNILLNHAFQFRKLLIARSVESFTGSALYFILIYKMLKIYY